MRIISGIMRGTKLFTLEGLDTRPTLDRVKEALFSKINFNLQGAVVLDLFAGSGALGLESLSRGAQKSYLCDSSNNAIKIINKNIEKTKTLDRIELLNCDYKIALEKFKKENIKFDIVFLDPPYATNFAENAAKYIIESNLLNKDGIIIIETDNKEKVLDDLDKKLLIEDIKRYGRVYLLFLRKVQN